MIQRVKDSFPNDILFVMVCLVLYFQQILHQKKMRCYKIKKKIQTNQAILTTGVPHYPKVAEHSCL